MYSVIKTSDIIELGKCVQNAINDGMQPLGNLVVINSASGANVTYFFQVMVKYE